MNKLQRSFVNQGMAAIDSLNGWEQQFIRDMNSRPDSYELTPAQNKSLNSIQRKAVSGAFRSKPDTEHYPAPNRYGTTRRTEEHPFDDYN